MQVNWRHIHAARNSFAVLYAACETSGFRMNLVDGPDGHVTCYSLSSITARQYRDEIARAGCITIAGGPYATACPREVAQYADYVVVGEGEYTLPRLLADLRDGGGGKVPGVMSEDHFEPARTGVILDAYPPFSEYTGYIEISRGCPFSCGYCQTPRIFGHCMRHRSIDTIARYANRHSQPRFVAPNAFAYGSDGVHPRFDRLERLLQRCRQRIYLGTFPSEVRPEFVCDTSLSLMNRYCANTRLQFGAQSGSDAVLGTLQRGHTSADVIRAVELCKEYAVTPVVDFIVGFPFETDEDQLATLEMIRWVARSGRVHVHRFLPLPGTPLAGTTARALLPETEKTCGELALRGKLTGSWTDPEIRFLRRPSNDIP